MTHATQPGEYPHVTSILADAGLIDTQWFRDIDLERGRALHSAAEYLDAGDLDWSSVDPVVLPRLRQYQRFLAEVRPEILAVEEHVVNETHRYQGRLDRRLLIDGREGILDIKGPSMADWNALQLVAYAMCFPRPLARWNLYLADHDYRLVEHRGRQDWKIFLAAITIANWRNKP